jgi:NTP pyrophosphatase (non-canonical NTP hydrolase)
VENGLVHLKNNHGERMTIADSPDNWDALDGLQKDINAWQRNNFPHCQEWELALGVSEEAGEIADCVLKSHRKIRSDEFPEERLKDAVGDIVLYLFGICDHHDWLLSQVVSRAAREVLARKWT